MKARFSAAGLVAVASLLLPRVVAACPMCASQQPGGSARIAALGLMILLPFSIVLVVVRALRRAGGLTSEDGAEGRAGMGACSERAPSMRELSP